MLNLQISRIIVILKNNSNGSVVYTETITSNTNSNGLISIKFGNNLENIDWSSDIFFIKSETDPTGGDNFTITNTSQILSVPYAIHSKTAESLIGGIQENDPDFNSWDKSTGVNISVSQISDFISSVYNHPAVLANTAKNSYPVEDAQKVANLSGINTGDETAQTIRTKISVDLNNKVDKIAGKGLSTNDYTTAEKIKLSGIADGAEVNVNADWNATSGDALILNKPTIDGSETKLVAGTNVTITGNGTNSNPYVINSTLDSPSNYYIGQEKDGGIIFFIYRGSDGLEHGLIVTKDELTSDWFSLSGINTLAYSHMDGQSNTNKIMASSSSMITDLKNWLNTLGSGWYYPASQELLLLMQNSYLVNKTTASGFTPITIFNNYGTSTEMDYLNFYGVECGYLNKSSRKSDSFRFRAIRSF